MSRKITIDRTVPDVKYSLRSFTWNVYWGDMKAIDASGRSWNVMVDGDRIYLDFGGKVQATMSVDEVKSSYRSYMSGREFVNKWVGQYLLK